MAETKTRAKRPLLAASASMVRLLPGWAAGRPVRRVLVVGTAGLLAASVLGAAPAGAGAGATAPHWSIVPSPNRTGTHGEEAANTLTGVSCVSARACFAVGAYSVGNQSSVSKVLTERWNGRKWAVQSAPSPTSGSYLSAVSCTSHRACTAVGYFVTRGAKVRIKSLAERWNGTKWAIQQTPNPYRFSFLSAVSCISRRACIAVGMTQHGVTSLPLAERWNGRKWAVMPARNPRRTTDASLSGVSCTSASACTAVGLYYLPPVSGISLPRMLAERWNGRKWAIQHSPPIGPVLTGVSCTSARACTAVGSYGDPVLNNMVPFAEHWNGKKWARQAVPTPAKASFLYFSAVSCLSRRACAAVGAYYDPVAGQVALAEHWNGKKWAIQPIPTPPRLQLPNTDLFINGTSCASVTSCTTVGDYVYSQSDPTSIRTLTERYAR
jgi:hypothetical protein